jgi:hypothetical protein
VAALAGGRLVMHFINPEECAISLFHMTRDATDANEYWREHPLREAHVPHHIVDEETARAFERCVDSASDERAVQVFLEMHPAILVQVLHGSPRFVLSRQRLGAELITDFVLGVHDSDGYGWLAVELESPRLSLFTKSGDPRAQLTHGIRQIQDWRAWLQRNQNYASRARTQSGLGLIDIRADIPGLVLMGRRALVDAGTNDRRRQMASDLKIHIHTYDHLIEAAWAAVLRH